MKVVFLSRYQNVNKRGVETFTYELGRRLSKKMDIEILSGKDSDDLALILKGKYDVVVPENGGWQGLKASFGRWGGYKTVVIGHSGIGRDDIWNIAVCAPDVYVALTEKMLRWADKWAWKSRVVKISNGVDLNKFTPDGAKFDLGLKHPIILCVGALVWYKHQENVIDAVSLLEKGSLVLIGSGPDYEKLIREGMKKLGQGRFDIINATYDQMPKYYRSCDLFTLPSWDREAFGIAYLEALASNLPVVAPNDFSRQEIVGKAGILTDTSHVQDYRLAIEKALSKNWRLIPREQAKEFSWDIIAGKYQRIFEDLFG